MNEDYVIFTDVSADVPEETVKKYDVRFVGMQLVFNDEERDIPKPFCKKEIKEFYQSLKSGTVVRSSQISPQQYAEAFTPCLEQGKSVLYLGLSSGLSGTCQSAKTAANELNEKYAPHKVEVVDSLTATAGLGFLLDFVGENKLNGVSLEDNVKWLENNKLNLCHRFMIDDLMFLKRGGRIPASLAVIGKILNLKPVLYIDEQGKLISIAKKQGVKLTLNHIASEYAKNRSGSGKDEKVIIVHADAPDKAEYLKEKVLEINPDAQITTVYMGPIVGCHAGPGLCGMGYWGKR